MVISLKLISFLTNNISVKELNLAFLPIEERVFSLDNPAAYNEYYGGKMTDKRLDEIAEQLVINLL